MDGQSRTCIEWMCNDEYEPGSFDLTNIMSPPDHESFFHSLMNATPLGELGGEEWQAVGLATPTGGGTGRPLASLPSDPALITPTSLVALVQHMELAPADRPAAAAAGHDREEGDSAADPAAVRSLTEAVAEALAGGTDPEDGAGRGLTRVASDTGLAERMAELKATPRVRRPSVSCPSSPPQPRRAGNSFFTPSLFHPERSAEICREWRQHHPDQVDAAAGPAGAGLPSRASLASAGGMTGQPAAERKKRTKPRPSRLRELNFLAPSSM